MASRSADTKGMDNRSVGFEWDGEQGFIEREVEQKALSGALDGVGWRSGVCTSSGIEKGSGFSGKARRSESIEMATRYVLNGMVDSYVGIKKMESRRGLLWIQKRSVWRTGELWTGWIRTRRVDRMENRSAHVEGNGGQQCIEWEGEKDWKVHLVG